MLHRRAFTLIELLIVVAMIGLLMAILVPSLAAARGSAKRAACASNLRQIGVGLRAYLDLSNERFPYASDMPSITPHPVDGNDPIFIADVLRENVPDGKVFKCPNDQGNIDRDAPNFGKTYFETERSSYAYSSRLSGETIQEYIRRAEESGRRRNRVVQFRVNSICTFHDYNNFHAAGGSPGAQRYLYVDGHVTDYEVDRGVWQQ
jgi:prepilin-type N-terminal cleavage/methylation domain-containing protein